MSCRHTEMHPGGKGRRSEPCAVDHPSIPGPWRNGLARGGADRRHRGGDPSPPAGSSRPRPRLRRLRPLPPPRATDRAFLRRYRALHPPPLLGFLDHNGFHPALSPHAAAPVARAVSLAADFSFSFLPSPADRWIVRDARGGRVLLDRAPEDDGGEGSPVSTEVAVCDPLHRRCVVLPPIPDDLAASVEHPVRVEFDRWCEAFLVPRADDGTDAGDETSFEVIWMAQCKAKLVAFAFSSATGQWRAVASLLWRDLRSGAGPVRPVIYGRQYAHGCFYWTMDWHWPNKLLVLDTRRMAFSVADLPSRLQKATDRHCGGRGRRGRDVYPPRSCCRWRG
ncbi:hypothetical protein PR202_ga29606 [Eleusine coracana subsp. coracana]|uniref:Uncharacterized protein n=1 Tax=Eleusine coracana subsp. coracana TaxID=191504 RepID=A0AAV5DK08_ELECO|nr:hypothetical protein PR202_ga29606 [Eleusine coracana subsp. coracana]